ncbi:MAG TPA: GAF domain-containing protein, partial [Chloroflexota bacterium]|nr:GAF domain-containing protein [Chloroflexota bacterium]
MSGSASGVRRRPSTGWGWPILRDAPLGVVLRQHQGESMEPSRQSHVRLLGLGTLALSVPLLIVVLTTRGVVKTIRKLTASTRAIAQRKFDEPSTIQGSDEIAESGRTLDLMRRRLQRSMADIRGCNARLERCVQERTSELERSRAELEQSRDYLQTLIDRLSILNSIGVTVNRSLDLGTTLSGALTDTLKLMGMKAGAVYLVDEQSGELELAAHHGLSLEAARVAANLGLSASLCAAAAQAGEPLVVEDTTRYARGSRSVLCTENMRCMVRVPFKSSSGHLLGTMCLGTSVSRSFSKAEVDLLVSVGNQVAAAVQNARLYEEIRRKGRMRGELLEKVIAAQEAERKRIARELHDQTSQALAALAVAVETAAAQAEAGENVSGSLAKMKLLAVDTLEEVHRLIFDLRPTLLDDLGLISALRWYVETRLGEVGIKVRLEVGGEERRLAPQIETALYRVVQ